jgi:dolichol kinase
VFFLAYLPVLARSAERTPPPITGFRNRLRREISRKAIHVASVAVPLGVWFAPRPVAAGVLVAVAIVALTVEALRSRHRATRYQFLRRTRTMLRPRERRGITGATWMAVAYAAAVIVFPTPVAVVAMLYNGLGDAAAALVGRRWGRRRLPSGKSWEGAAAALTVGFTAGAVMPGVPLAAAAVGAAAAAALELADLPPDDNIWVTLGGGAALAAATVVLG